MKPQDEKLILERNFEISELNERCSKDPELVLFVDKRILNYSEDILIRLGQKYQVEIGKTDRRKFRTGMCYQNSIRKTDEGYLYVEGYILHRINYHKISHAWNVDKDGNHYDFTLKDNNEYDYYGLVVPTDLVYEVGSLKGGNWGSCLPYIKVENNDLIKTKK